MKKLLLLLGLSLFAVGVCSAQSAVRWDVGGPIAGLTTLSTGPIPYLVALTDGVQLNWCQYPANSTQGSACTNFATTFTDTTLGTACPSTQPIVLQNSNVCRSTSDALGNLGVYTVAGTYTYTLTDGSITYGPYVVTLGGSGSIGGATVKINNAPQSTTNFNSVTPSVDAGFTAAIAKSNGIDTIFELPTLAPSEFCLTGSGIGSQLNIGFQGTTNPCSNPAITIIQQPNGGMGLFGPITIFNTLFAGAVDVTTGPLYNDVVNCASNPAVTNKLARFFGGCTIQTLVSDTSGILGVSGNSGGASLGAQIAIAGHIPLVFDGATTAGDWVVNSTTVAGDGHDTGIASNLPAPAGTQVVGIVNSTNGAAGTYQIYVTSGASGGGNITIAAGSGLTLTGAALSLYKTCTTNQVEQFDGTNWICATLAGTGNTTSTSLTLNHLPKANGANSIIDSLLTDNGAQLAYTGSSGEFINSGGVSSILGLGDSGTNCPTVGLTASTSYWCSGSFLPLWITDVAGTITTTQAELRSFQGAANGYPNLDGAGNVPANQLFNWANTWFTLTSCTSLGLSTGGSIFTNCDLGASPDSTLVGVTDNATSATDNSTNFFTDTGSASFHISAAFRIRGVNQMQICEQTGPQGEIVFGSAVTCANINQSPFAKVVEVSNTAGHSVLRMYQNSTSDNNTGGMLAMTNATASGTGWYYAKGCAGATGSDSGCGSGTVNWSIRGDGLFTGAGSLSALTLTGITGSIQCLHVSSTGVVTGSGADCGTGAGSGVWSALTNATAALTLANGTNASTFNQTSAVNWTWANTTAAVHLTPQNSPIFNLNGTYFTGAVSAADSWTIQDILGTADNGASTLTFAHTGSSGVLNASFPGAVTSGNDGVHAAELSLPGNTTAPTIPTNTANILGPSSASFTAYGIQLPTAAPTVGPKVFMVGAVSSSISQGSFIDLPDVHIYPAANCVATVAGAGWSTALTPACIAGSNNLGGQLPFADASTAQFETEIPLDWDTASQPFVNVFFNSGANTSGTVIFNVAVACTKSDGSITSDPAFNTADALTTKTMTTASRTWSTTTQLTQVTSGNNCIPGGTMLVKVTRASDSAGSVVQVTKLVMTTPRLLTVQAN